MFFIFTDLSLPKLSQLILRYSLNLSDQQIVSQTATYVTNPLLPQSPSGPSQGRTTYETRYVKTLFDGIAHRYDLLNHILSSGLDIFWRREAIKLLQQHHPRRILDVATGTGDFAIEASRLHPDRIVGLDIADEMLRHAEEKIRRKKLQDLITLEKGEAENLPFPESSFEAATVAFGVRNFADLSRGLAEIHRVLKPGGAAVVLEFSRPRSPLIRALYEFYSRRIIPAFGGMISRHRDAYEYLPKTIKEFPSGEGFSSLLMSVGFGNVSIIPLTFGIVTIYYAIKHPQGN